MSERLTPFVQRVNVMAARLAGLLTVWRAYEHNMDVGTVAHLTATALDVQLALEIARAWYAHGHALLSHLTPRRDRPDPLASLPDSVRDLYAALPAEFKRADADEAGEGVGIKPRTVKANLQKLQEAGMLQRQGHSYRKVAAPEIPTEDDVEGVDG